MRTRTITAEDLQTELNEDLSCPGQIERLADQLTKQRRMMSALLETLLPVQLLKVYEHFNHGSRLQYEGAGLIELTAVEVGK